MIPCQELKAKRLIRFKTPKKAICIKQSTESYKYKIAKSSSPSASWKLNTSLTQKDTMDRRSWIKKFRKKGMRRTQRNKKFTSTQKYKMAWKWGTNEYFCLPCVTILWCLSWKLLEDRGKMKLIYLASKELYWLWSLGFHFLNRTIIND